MELQANRKNFININFQICQRIDNKGQKVRLEDYVKPKIIQLSKTNLI